MTDLVAFFKTEAEKRGYLFIYGEKQYREFEMSQLNLAAGKKVMLLFPIEVRPVLLDGIWTTYIANTKLFIGRKFEESTTSSIAETNTEKYNNRLSELSTELDTFLVETIGCHTSHVMKSLSYFQELNQTSASVDFAGSSFSFEFR